MSWDIFVIHRCTAYTTLLMLVWFISDLWFRDYGIVVFTALEHIIDMLSYEHLTLEGFKPAANLPRYEAVLKGIAHMIDRMLLPESSNSEADKASFE